MTLADRLGQLVEGRSRAGTFSGVVAIQQAGEPLFQEAYGFAHRGWAVPNRLDTRFRVASVGKMFTAAAVLQLVEAGRLTLETSVTGLLDLRDTTVPPNTTVYQLLTMTSGMADWIEEGEGMEEEWQALARRFPIYLLRDNADYLPLFAGKPPAQPAGGHRYNNAGYILLGLIIEQVSGLPYFDYVRQNIFARAEMERSDFVALDAIGEEVAEGYVAVTDENESVTDWRKNIYTTTPEAAADGGAVSCAPDLFGFSQALRAGKLLSEAMTREMLAPQVIEDEELVRGYRWMYGYGNYFLMDEGGAVVRWGHTGEEEGVSCRLYYYPGMDTDVVILGNQSECAGELGWEIHGLLVEE